MDNTISREKNKVGGLMLPSDFKTYHKVTVVKTVWYWQNNGQIYQWNSTDSPEIDPQTYSQLLFDKGPKAIQWRENRSSRDGAKTTRHPHAKK